MRRSSFGSSSAPCRAERPPACIILYSSSLSSGTLPSLKASRPSVGCCGFLSLLNSSLLVSMPFVIAPVSSGQVCTVLDVGRVLYSETLMTMAQEERTKRRATAQ